MTSQSKAGPAFLTAFGLPFLAAGLLFTIKSAQAANQPVAQRIAGAMFGSVFAIIGGGLIFGAWFGYAKLREQAQRVSMNPDSPWLWRKDWAARRVESTNKARAIGWWTGAVLLNMISLPISIEALPQILRAHDPKYFLPVGFELIGLILVVGAIRATLRFERFGEAYFEMNSLPYSPGGHVSGALHLQMRGDAPHGVDLKLSCFRRITTGSGDNSSTQHVPLWEDSKNVSGASFSRGPLDTAIPVDFTIPADAFVTDQRKSNDQVVWALSANADVPGVDYSDKFDLPVFRTSSTWTSSVGTSQTSNEVVKQLGQFARTSTTPAELSQQVAEPQWHKAVVSETSNGLELYFPAARNPGRAALVVALAAGCTGLIFAMLHIARRPPIVVFVFIGLMDFILIMASVHAAISSTRIVVGNGTISWRKAVFGIGSLRTVPVSEIAAILSATGIQQAGSAGTFYSLKVRMKGGTNHTLVDEIADRQEARWIVSQMETRAGLALNTQVDISNFVYGPQPQPGPSQTGVFPSAMRVTTHGKWSQAVGAIFFLGWLAFIGFMILRTTRTTSRTRAASGAVARAAPRFIRTESMRRAALSEIGTWPVQQQAEELLARAVEHDTDALPRLVQTTPRWTSNIHRSDNLEHLEDRARYSSDLRVRRAEADLELAADGWEKNLHAADLLMQRVKSDASYRPAALYFLGILAGDGIETERSERFLIDYARNDPDAATRQWATEGLRFVGTDRSLDDLFEIFTHDRSLAVRDRAGCNVSDCGIYQRTQRLKLVPRLIDLVSDPALNPPMKSWSFVALREITGENLPADPPAWRYWYQTTAAAKRAEFAALPWWQVRGDN